MSPPKRPQDSARRASPTRRTRQRVTEVPQSDAETDFPPLAINSHRALRARQTEISRRLNARPDVAPLLLVNPALALGEINVSLSPPMVDHVLRGLMHPLALRQRREELTQSLTKAIGAFPQPNNPEWVATLLFETLGAPPLNTRGQQPVYLPPLAADAMERLQALRPPPRRGPRYERPHRLGEPVLQVVTSRPTRRRLDLDAQLPALRPLKVAPRRVDLETLYFYKDVDPIVRDLLELGIIQCRAFPIRTSDSFRRIKQGRESNVFRTWITEMVFPEGSDDEPDR